MTRRRIDRVFGLIVIGVSAALAGCRLGWTVPEVPPDRACIDAQTVLRQAAEDKDPVTRSNAIEAMGRIMGRRSGGIFRQALSDTNYAVRFAAAMAIGDVKFAAAKGDLLRMAGYKTPGAERQKSVFCAVIYALYRLGDDRHAGELGRLLFDPEAEIRGNAAMVMGKMGEPSAIGPLKNLLIDEQDAAVQLQVIEALALLGDRRSANILEAYTKTQFVDERLVAIPAMARIASPQAEQVLWGLLAERNPPRVRVAAAGALGRIGRFDEGAYRFCLRSSMNPGAVMRAADDLGAPVPEVAIHSLQKLAAMALGSLGRPAAVNVLHSLLGHPEGGVRVAAAMSILRLLPGAAAAKPLPGKRPDETTRDDRRKPPPRRRKLQSAGGKD